MTHPLPLPITIQTLPPGQARPGSDHDDPATGNPELAIQSAPTGQGQRVTLKKIARRLNRLTTAILQDGQAFEELPQDEARQVSEGLDTIEKLLKRASRPPAAPGQGRARASRRRPSGPLELKAEELMILKWLREKKFGTTSHIKSQLVIERATDRLRKLEKAGLLSSYRYQLHKGRQSEKCYWLSYAGAKYLTERGTATRYESRYVSRPPSEYMIHFRTMELEVPFEARRIGWKVIEPKLYNSVNPRPKNEPSKQARFLMELLDRQTQREIEQARQSGQYTQAATNWQVRDYQARKHLQIVPNQANHHVCYLPQADRAIIFILCPEDITGQFWEARLKEYGELAQQVKTFGVFYTRDQATSWLETINQTAIGVVWLEKLTEALRDITYDYTGQQG